MNIQNLLKIIKPMLSELEIKPQYVSLEKVKEYFYNYINEDKYISTEEWKTTCEPYCKKYKIDDWIIGDEFEILSQRDLNQIYKDMQTLMKGKI